LTTAPLEVSLVNVKKRFGPRAVLDGVSLSIAPRETVALIGPSGGGKSTLLRCINALTPLDGGEIRVGPHVLTPGDSPAKRAVSAQVRRMFGMIFQDFQLFPHLTALGNVVEAPIEARRRGLALLQRVGLGDRADAYPRELSGGQKQRVAIARAMAMEPRGLLCDEITSALDPELKGEVLSVLEDLKRDGITLIVVTHEIGFARRAADRIVVLDEGRVLEEGPPQEVLQRPRMPRTQRFLSQVLA
jgi:polar amino acid transport system ATP-binding protein